MWAVVERGPWEVILSGGGPSPPLDFQVKLRFLLGLISHEE